MQVNKFKSLSFKKTISVVLLVLLSVGAQAQNRENGCEIKLERLQEQLEYAKLHGNENRVRGLEQAIDNVKSNCGGGYLQQQEQTEQGVSTSTVEGQNPALSIGCERKKANLQRQLEYAKQYGNTYRIRGLERAIADVERNCR